MSTSSKPVANNALDNNNIDEIEYDKKTMDLLMNIEVDTEPQIPRMNSNDWNKDDYVCYHFFV